jgi:signal transduction histidine kinase
MDSHAAGRFGLSRENIGGIPWRMYLIIGSVGLILTGIVVYGFITADRMNKMDLPLMDTVSEAKLETTRAHHQIESIVSGENFDNIESALARLDHAFYHLQESLDGGENAAPHAYPIEDPELQREISVAKENLIELKAVTWQRLASRQVHTSEKEVDSRYFEQLQGFMHQIDRIRARLEAIKTKNFKKFRVSQLMIISLCISLTLIIGIAFHRFERRSATDFFVLRSVKERLEEEISERKRSARRREELVTEIRNFAAIVSHDLRGPLVNLKGFVREITRVLEKIKPEMAVFLTCMPEDRRKEIAPAIEEALPEALDFITASALRMETMIQAVLQLSRIEERKLNPVSINMNTLLSDVMESFAYRIKQQRIQVSVAPLPQTRADRFAMEQIFSNLISNAIQYLAPDRPGEIAIGAEQHPNETLFYVRDNGRGIKQSDMTRIFDIFQRVGSADVPGEGVGLTYTRTLARRHGGRIWCESRLDEGSIFFFTIEVRPEENQND